MLCFLWLCAYVMVNDAVEVHSCVELIAKSFLMSNTQLLINTRSVTESIRTHYFFPQSHDPMSCIFLLSHGQLVFKASPQCMLPSVSFNAAVSLSAAYKMRRMARRILQRFDHKGFLWFQCSSLTNEDLHNQSLTIQLHAFPLEDVEMSM